MTTPQLPAKKMELSRADIEAMRHADKSSDGFVKFMFTPERLDALCDMALASLTPTQPQGQEWRAIVKAVNSWDWSWVADEEFDDAKAMYEDLKRLGEL